MEGLTRLVSESMARHGFDRPLDYRRLHWSRWFRCESPHSLLFVPSKPGVFAVAEEIMDLGPGNPHVGTDAFVRPASEASVPNSERGERSEASVPDKDHLSNQCQSPEAGNQQPEAASRRMLAVSQFFEDDDMAFVLDRMLSRPESHVRAPDLRSLLRPLRRHRRSSPTPHHLQRPESMDGHRRGKGHRHRLPLRHFARTNPINRIRTRHRCPAVALCQSDQCSCGDGRIRPSRERSEQLGHGTCFFCPDIVTDGLAARLWSRQKHSLSNPIPLRLLAGGCGGAALIAPWKSGALAPRRKSTKTRL